MQPTRVSTRQTAPAPSFSFEGETSEFSLLHLKGFLFSLATLGYYLPWAWIRARRYLLNKTHIFGSPFGFHGSGSEAVSVFLQVMAMVVVLAGVVGAAVVKGNLGFIWASAGMAVVVGSVLLAYVSHWYIKYTVTRTSWKGLRFNYYAGTSRFVRFFLKNWALTLLTGGLYAPFFVVKVRRRVLRNVQLGNIRFEFTGQGEELLGIHLKGMLLTLLTLGGYLPLYLRDVHVFLLSNVLIEQEGLYSRLQLEVERRDWARLVVVNLAVVVATLGLGLPWATLRTRTFLLRNLSLIGQFDPTRLHPHWRPEAV